MCYQSGDDIKYCQQDNHTEKEQNNIKNENNSIKKEAIIN